MVVDHTLAVLQPGNLFESHRWRQPQHEEHVAARVVRSLLVCACGRWGHSKTLRVVGRVGGEGLPRRVIVPFVVIDLSSITLSIDRVLIEAPTYTCIQPRSRAISTKACRPVERIAAFISELSVRINTNVVMIWSNGMSTSPISLRT